MNKYFISKTSIAITTAKRYRDELLHKFCNEKHLHEFISCGAADIFFGCIQSELTVKDLEKAELEDRL